MEMPINDAGIALLEEFESFVGHAYPDPYSPLGKALRARNLWASYLRKPFPIPADLQQLSGHPWTIGYGFTDGVKEGDRMVRLEANRRLAIELEEYMVPVVEACTVMPNANQLAAMTCLAWNIGVAGFKRSTVLKAHNRRDHQAAARAFGLWNRAGGEESPGLTRRRAAEAALYLKPTEFAEPLVMAQAVEAETTLKTSPIAIGTTATTAVAALATVTEVSTQVKTIRDGLGLGDYAPYLMLALAVSIGGYVIWQRVKQRVKGWA